MKYRVGIIVGVCFLFLLGCKKTKEDCSEIKSAAAFVLDYPENVDVNVLFYLSINYLVDNSCGDFHSVEGSLENNILELKLKASYEGCNCDAEFEEKVAVYPITFDEPGTYTLKLWVAEGEYDTYVVVAD